MDIELGNKVKDIVTGLEGIAVAKIVYMNGCVQYGVKSQIPEATLKEAGYIDEGQLEYVDEGVTDMINKEEEEGPGGDQPDRPKKLKY